MKDNNKKKTIVLLFVWILMLIIIPLITLKIENNMSSENKSYLSSKLDIQDYDVTLDVDKDNKIDVTEKVTVNIPTSEYNGIYKSIPLWQEYYNKDGKKVKKKIIITNLRVIGEKFVLDKHKDRVGIRIGSTRTKVNSGLHTYTIKYRYNVGKDTNINYDELVFNLFDHYDNTKIMSMNVIVNMPKKFGNNVMFLKGNEDVTNKINYQINDNTLNVHVDNYLLDNSLTMNVTLNDKYFVGGTYNYGRVSLLLYLITIAISIGSIIAWKKYNTNSAKRVETVEVYAPDDLDAAEIGYIYGETDMKKLTVSLIISLASKGYISIEDVGKKKYKIINIGKDNNNLKKLSIAEQLVYQELFKNGDSNILSEDKSFPKVFGKISMLLESITEKKINNSETKKVMGTISSLLVVSIIIWMISYLLIKDLDPKLEPLHIISFISIFITGFISIFMNQRTNYGQIITARVKGFRDYLVTVEKEKLNDMVMENPNYFYDILPYTYALGISDKWIDNFGKKNVPNIDIDALSYYEDNLFMIISE